jgi:hypothetical protein
MSDSIYNMKLHETLVFDYRTVLRVPGGWIYECPGGTCVFVPYDNEFQKATYEVVE